MSMAIYLHCCQEKPILTSCWNCFFDLLSIAFVIIIIQNGLPQRILPSQPDPVHLLDGKKEEINTSPCLRLAILGHIRKD